MFQRIHQSPDRCDTWRWFNNVQVHHSSLPQNWMFFCKLSRHVWILWIDVFQQPDQLCVKDVCRTSWGPDMVPMFYSGSLLRWSLCVKRASVSLYPAPLIHPALAFSIQRLRFWIFKWWFDGFSLHSHSFVWAAFEEELQLNKLQHWLQCSGGL